MITQELLLNISLIVHITRRTTIIKAKLEIINFKPTKILINNGNSLGKTIIIDFFGQYALYWKWTINNNIKKIEVLTKSFNLL